MRSELVGIIVEFLLLSMVSCNAQQLTGCTDPQANNYDPDATINDGSCTYDPVSVSPQQTYPLSDQLNRTSGLIFWDGNLWTQNDHADTILYGLDTTTATIERTYALSGVKNFDWEEISQDRDCIYIGDFGNNLGNRKDLHILRIKKSSLLDGNPVIDTIWFYYSDQKDFSTKEPYQTDFDCEAMIVSDDSIYLLTKQWISAQTNLYNLSKEPGYHEAVKKDSYNVQGLITGATYIEKERLVVLCGYTRLLQPFLTILYDFGGHDFFSGNKRRLDVSLPFHQIEGITSRDGLRYYISNEEFTLQEVISNPQKLHLFDLSSFLAEYFTNPSSDIAEKQNDADILVFPNPASNNITIRIIWEFNCTVYKIYDQMARIVLKGILTDESSEINIRHLLPGIFTLTIGEHDEKTFRIIKTQ